MSGKIKLILWGVIFFSSFMVSPRDVEAAFVASLNVQEVAVSPGNPTTIQWSAIQGVLPYTCSISRSDGSYVRAPWTINSTSEDDGEFTTVPNESTTYTLVCTDSANIEKRDSDSITVSSTPVVKLSANPATLPATGGSTSISWQVGLATSCTPTGGTTAWRALQNMHTGGNQVYTLSSTTTFTLECFNSQGQSSGKKSIKVGVGEGSNICGNGIEETGEECDLGASGNGVCPLKCSASCQNNGCSSVVSITINASPNTYDAGDSVKITWSAKNAVSCDAVNGQGFAGTTIGTSGSVTVKPTLTHQNYTIECYDSGGLSATKSTSVALDVDYDVDIISFGANPNPIPFGYAGDVSFSFKVQTEPVGAEPTCSLGFQAGPGSWSTKGTPLTSSNGTITLPLSQLTTNAPDAGPGGKSMGIKCTISDGTFDGLSTYADTIVKFQSDPNQAPAVSLTVGMGSDRSLDGPVAGGASVTVYRGLGGAERCDWTDSRTGTSSLAPFVGEQTFNTVVNQTTTFTLECWNGTLSSKKEFTVTVASSSSLPPGQNPGPGQSPGPGTTNPGPTGPAASNVTVSFGNIVGFSDVNGFLTRILSFLQGFIVTLALIFIVIGGFLYITSAGNDSQMETAKKCILGALIGLALGIAAPAFLKEIYTILGTNTSIPDGVGTTLSVLQIAENVLSFLLTIIGIIAIIMLIVGGIMYLTAAGNEDQIDKGKKIVKYSIIGILIALASLVLVRQVAGFFS